MKQIESTGISRRRLLAIAGVSAGATLLARRPLFADQDWATATVVSATARGSKNIWSFSCCC
jgi:hypothetical protein